MGTFKCQGCGNLHGAPVEACGLCGSPTVVAVDDQGNPFGSNPAAPYSLPTLGARSDTTPPGPSEFERLINEWRPLVESFLEKREAQANRRNERHAQLDEANEERDERKTAAALELIEALTQLAHAATSKVIADTKALSATAKA